MYPPGNLLIQRSQDCIAARFLIQWLANVHCFTVINHSIIMKYSLLSAMFIVALGIVGSVVAQDFRVVAVNESFRTANASLFHEANPETLKKLMPDGSSPMSTSSFVLFAGEETILFDASLGGEPWVKKLTDLGVKPESVKLILLTHLHGDHIGGLLTDAQTRRFPNAKVLCSTPEYHHWLPKDVDPRTPQLSRIKSAYGQDFEKTFEFDDVVFTNPNVKIKALDAAGHTPGHTVFLIESAENKENKLLIIGDLLHVAGVQFPAPEICATFDIDKEQSVIVRKRILDFAAQENIPIGGMHLPAPSIGTVKKEGNGYSFELVK
jgi:glyoxylase-like metal-dependent hydrolase (beta-lactamase superfamily II)